MTDNCVIREVRASDLDAMMALETVSFESDRLSRRSFVRWIKGEHRIFLVVECEGQFMGYGLVLLQRGTRLARLYSLAIDPKMRGVGLGQTLTLALEAAAVAEDRLFMRLEVSKENHAAINLYRRLGYSIFGELPDYYEDHTDALRMQKRIRFPERVRRETSVPWYRQSTPFTCGPASLMMAMAGIDKTIELEKGLELDLWRESTTIFMTSGIGGCHPLGLALAAQKRGYMVEVFMSHAKPLFLQGVRSPHKKEIMAFVHHQFAARSRERGILVHHSAVRVAKIEKWLAAGHAVMVLISSYRITGDKAPHWVVITAIDELCLYVHDPDPDTDNVPQSEMDSQHIPIAKEDFAKMTSYGSQRFSAALLLKRA